MAAEVAQLPAIKGASGMVSTPSKSPKWGGLSKKINMSEKKAADEMTKSMLMTKLTKTESLLGIQTGMNKALQQKMAGLLRKLDDRDQHVYTLKTAMNRVERDCAAQLKKMQEENRQVLAGQKYEDMKSDLRQRAALIMDKDNAVAKLERRNEQLEKKVSSLTGQLALSKEQTTEAEKQWGDTTKQVNLMKSRRADAGIKLRETKESVVFLEAQLQERELETAELRVTVQMLQEDLVAARRSRRDYQPRPRTPEFSPRDIPDSASPREDDLEQELVSTHARVAKQNEEMDRLVAMAQTTLAEARSPSVSFEDEDDEDYEEEDLQSRSMELGPTASFRQQASDFRAAESERTASEVRRSVSAKSVAKRRKQRSKKKKKKRPESEPPPLPVSEPEPEPEPEPAPTPKTDTAATRSRTKGALLGGLRSGALEEAVAKMEEDTAAEEAAAPDPRIEQWGKSVFQQFDTDKNGKLTPQELSAALKSLPRKKPKTIPPGAKFMSLDEMIAAMDEDGDGSIDLAEWLSRLGSCAGLAAALDENVNADGEIANFNAPLPPGLQAEKAEAPESEPEPEPEPEPEAEDPAASLGLVGSAEEDAAAAKMQAVQRGRSARRGVEEKQAEQLAAPELKRARKKFDQMDKDGNGTLDAAEMRELALWVFSSFHPGGEALPADRQQKEADKLTKRLDADGDGKLSFEEFAAWFKRTCAGIAKYRKGLAQRKRAEAAARKEEGGHPAFGSLAEAEQAALQMADDVATKLQSTAVDIEAKSGDAALPAAATLEPAEAASPYAAPKASDEEMRKIAEKHAAELQEEFDAMAHLLSEEEKTELQKELLTLRSSMNADEVEQVLLSMDTDGDGIVDSEELRAGVVKLSMEQQSRGV